MTGKEIKEYIKKKRLHQYEVAKELGINEFTLSRWLRDDIDGDMETKILTAIESIIKVENIL